MRNLHLELLIGRRVCDTDGKTVGRIEECKGTIHGKRCYIDEFHVGTGALLERLGISTAQLVGWTIERKPLRIPWQKLDLTDPEHPRLRCAKEELE